MRAADAARSADEDGRVARLSAEGERLKVGPGAERQLDVTHGVPGHRGIDERRAGAVVGEEPGSVVLRAQDSGLVRQGQGGAGLDANADAGVVMCIHCAEAWYT